MFDGFGRRLRVYRGPEKRSHERVKSVRLGTNQESVATATLAAPLPTPKPSRSVGETNAQA